jgi:hypothetical protein
MVTPVMLGCKLFVCTLLHAIVFSAILCILKHNSTAAWCHSIMPVTAITDVKSIGRARTATLMVVERRLLSLILHELQSSTVADAAAFNCTSATMFDKDYMHSLRLPQTLKARTHIEHLPMHTLQLAFLSWRGQLITCCVDSFA